VTFPSLVFEIWCSQGFQDAQTRSLTDRHTRIQSASGGAGMRICIKMKKMQWLVDNGEHDCSNSKQFVSLMNTMSTELSWTKNT